MSRLSQPSNARTISRYFQEFIKMESSSGLMMIVFAVLAMLAANSPFLPLYKAFVDYPITFGFQLKDVVKDVLMVFFFLVIGLELKREWCEGLLSKRDQVVLPLCAAIGGMVVPALIFVSFNYHSADTIHGWAIPSATDIAFALAILTLFGKGVPPAIKIFLLAVAIFDDLGAIIIIALFYNSGLTIVPLFLAMCGVVGLIVLNRMHIVAITPYIFIGLLLWICFHYAGIHTTLSGVIVGFSIPMYGKKHNIDSPLNRSINTLHPWVNFLVLPLFAFTSAGVSISGIALSDLLKPLPLGIALGLFFGKQIGIFSVSWFMIKTKLAKMPENATWRHLYAVSVIAGIGFTMSLFIGMLAFSDVYLQEMVKIGVIGGSLFCILVGVLVLRLK